MYIDRSDNVAMSMEEISKVFNDFKNESKWMSKLETVDEYIDHQIREGLFGEYDFDALVNLMDDELREQVHSEIAPCTDEEFWNRYHELHVKKFGEEFAIDCM